MCSPCLEEWPLRWHADIVVMGTHGRRGFRRLMLGSVAQSYVRISNCPVLLVPYREEAEAK